MLREPDPATACFLVRRADGRLVRVRHARLSADRSVSFAVGPGRATTYVVKLPSTRKHGTASTTVTVAAG